MGLLACLRRCLSPLSRFLEHPADTTDDKIRKALLVPSGIATALFSLVMVINGWSRGSALGVCGPGLQVLSSLVLVIYTSTTKRLSQEAAGLYICSIFVPAMLAEFWVYGQADYYTSAVVLMDGLLLCGCHKHFTTFLFSGTLVVIFVSWVEQVYGTFGIYDAIPEEWSGVAQPAKKPRSLAASILLCRWFVFSSDFLMTRNFSKGMREQRERVERSVVVAQQIASALARFDLEKAEAMVLAAEGLPLELLDALSCLLGNLRSYKPYLPQSCLPGEVESPSEDEASVGSLEELVREGTGLSYRREAMKKRAVTLAQLNIRNFADVVNELGSAQLMEYHSEYIKCIMSYAKATKGLVEHFLCDRVLVSFNAAKPCLKHRVQALAFAESMLQLALAVPDTKAALSTAITSGEVLSGSMGCEGLRSYSLVGPVAAWVPLLERVAVRLDVPVITDSSVYMHTRDVGRFRLLGLAKFEKLGNRRQQLLQFMGMKESNDEWVYRSEWSDSHEAYNKALGHLLVGDPETALKIAKAAQGFDAELLERIETARATSGRTEAYWDVGDIAFEEIYQAANPQPRPSRVFTFPES